MRFDGSRGPESVVYSPLWPAKLTRLRLNSGKVLITEIGRELRCSGCNEYWPADTKFYFTKPSSNDGLQGWCKACMGEYKNIRQQR